jgi:hypothetical protein
VIVRNAAKADMQVAIPAKSVAVPALAIEVMLSELPTAHPAPPIGRRMVGHGCDGVAEISRSHRPGALAATARSRRIRFVYFPLVDGDDRHADYHRHLVNTEVLLDRVMAARLAGPRPIAPALDDAAEARATVRPPRELFQAATLEYQRWYDEDGAARAQPLTLEVLAVRLADRTGMALEEARNRAGHRSHALAAADQAWLIDRRATALDHRPLNQGEFQALAAAIEGTWQASGDNSPVARTNRQIAQRVAAILGSVLDEYVATPFRAAPLSEAFSERHLAHLRQTIEDSRQAESASGALLAGPKAWFAAKAARMRAEHQIGLSMSPAASAPMHLSGRPMVAVIGGKLRTFVNGWHRGSRLAGALPAFASFG